MTVSIVQNPKIDFTDVIARSPVSKVLGAEHTLDRCMRLSLITWAGMVDGKVACVWGIVPPSLMSERAYLWLITTDLAEAHQFLLVRYSQMVIKELLKDYPTLVGHCMLGQSRSRKWLEWLGASFGYPAGDLVPFTIKANHG